MTPPYGWRNTKRRMLRKTLIHSKKFRYDYKKISAKTDSFRDIFCGLPSI